MASQVKESTVEQAAVDWFAGLGYQVFYGPTTGKIYVPDMGGDSVLVFQG